MNNFYGKTVIITGASAGVGEACARAFAKLGAKLVLVARGEAGLTRIAEELGEHTDVMTVPMDVANIDDCVSLMKKASDHFGAIHVLVNNAGLHVRGDFEANEAKDYAAMVDVNLRAPIVLSKAALPYIRQSAEGAIVMVGSLAGITPVQGAATYSSTKAGLRFLALVLADELRDSGINVGVVSPGPIDTAFIMSEIDRVEDIVFSQPMSSPEEVAAGVIQIARGGKTEILIPAISGCLSKLLAGSPGLRRRLRPLLSKKGAANKEKYRRRKKQLQ